MVDDDDDDNDMERNKNATRNKSMIFKQAKHPPKPKKQNKTTHVHV